MDSSYLGKMYISLLTTNQIFCYMTRNSGVDCYAFTANDALVANVWNVIVVTWAGSGNAPTLYRCEIGGTLTNVTASTQVGTGTFWDDSSANLRIAARDPLDASFYAGGIADCALWNRVLNSTELADLGLGYSAEFSPSGLVFASRVTGSASPEINTTGGTNGTVTGTTSLTHPSIIYPSLGTTFPSRLTLSGVGK